MKIKILFLIAICLIVNLNVDAQTKIKTTDSYVYSLKQKITRYTNDLVSNLNKLIISSGKSADKQGDKKEIIYDANKFFLKKSDNAGVDIYFENLFEGIGVSKRSTGFTSMELLEQFSVLNKYKNMSLSLDDMRVSDLYYNEKKNSYLIKSSFRLTASAENNNDDDVVYDQEIDLAFINNSDNAFKIYMLSFSNNTIPNGYSKITPTSDKDELPGSYFLFRVKPYDSKIMVDDKEYEYNYGEKIPIEKGQHKIEIIAPNDNYEQIDIITKWITSDTGTVVIEKQLQLMDGSLSVLPGSDCMTGAQVDIYRMVEVIDKKASRKSKTEVTKYVKEKQPIMIKKIPIWNLELIPGAYKLWVHKDGYLPYIKKIDVAVMSKSNVTRTIDLKEDVVKTTIGNAACAAFCPKGGSCCCCSGSGKCRICQGKKEIQCICCSGLGVIEYDSNGSFHNCTRCKGTGKVKCYLCNGAGNCTACKGTGKN